MAKSLVDRPLTEAEWDALADPTSGRYEVLDGQLVVSASANADHSRHCEDLAHTLRNALRHNGLDLPVTVDVEWRTIANNVVHQAPRGDVVVGRSLDPQRLIHETIPLLVAEVWSQLTPPAVRGQRRIYWATVGIQHYWELCLGPTRHDATLEIWDLTIDTTFPAARAVGAHTIAVDEPFPIELTPAHVYGQAQRQAEREEQERDRAEKAEEQAAHEHQRAENAEAQAASDRQRADKAEVRSARLAARLRELGHGDD